MNGNARQAVRNGPCGPPGPSDGEILIEKLKRKRWGVLMRTEKPEICRDCKYARDKFGGMCYCDKEGLIVGYPKFYCEEYENDGQEIPEPENRA